ncbi:MAG: YeeE/YedE family protein [Alphaproteobacteria bacterium]|nr:YeeE/YedE family protein [Alphaproteobacteria bacterium]
MSPMLSLLLGGLGAGTAAGLLMLLDGRILGVAGFVAGVASGHDVPFRLAALLGLVSGGLLILATAPGLLPTVERPLGLSVGAGLLVGVGAALARGCTSGHLVCGLARLSPRSVVAALGFALGAVFSAGLVHGGAL